MEKESADFDRSQIGPAARDTCASRPRAGDSLHTAIVDGLSLFCAMNFKKFFVHAPAVSSKFEWRTPTRTMGANSPLQPTSLCGVSLLSLLLLQTLDIFIPPASLPSAPIAEDRLGGVDFLRWVWAQHVVAQFTLSVFGAVVIYGCAVFVARLIVRIGLGRTPNEGASQLAWPVIGLSIGAFGWGLRRWAKQELGSQFTYQISNPQSLVTSGPFSYVAHPGYAGSILHVCGFCILAVEPWNRALGLSVAMLATSIVVGILSMRIVDEERLLESHFGHAWTEHIVERWHLFPLVW